MTEQAIKLPKQRIEVLDIYRGFAIFGIFVVNIVIMNSTFLNQDEFAKQWIAPIDQVSEKLLQLFFYTKFFPIFSLLFGLGISMQAMKMLDKGHRFFSFFRRRMFLLFIFGVLHIVLLWSGDVLNLYAVLGLFIVLMIKKSNKTILVLSVVLLLFPFYNQVLEYVFHLINFQPDSYLSDYTGLSVNRIITKGTYTEGMKLRILEYLSNIPMLLGFLAPVAISMMLLGLYLGKSKVYNGIEAFILKIKKPMITIMVVTNVYRLLFFFVLVKLELYKLEIYREVFIKIMVLADVALGLFYLWVLGWLYYYNSNWRRVLTPLSYVGRMALTNYIMQSCIGLVIFSSIGFALYETLSPSETLLLAMIVFSFQIIFSRIWLTFFRFGPLEWLWRCLTYKKLLSIKA